MTQLSIILIIEYKNLFPNKFVMLIVNLKSVSFCYVRFFLLLRRWIRGIVKHSFHKYSTIIKRKFCTFFQMAPSGCFMCFNVETKNVSELKGIDVKYYRFNGLTTVNGLIYMVSSKWFKHLYLKKLMFW